MTQLITPTMPDRPRIARRMELSDRAAILAALTALAQQTDPLLGHGGLLFEVLEALQRGGMDVAGLLDCVMAEVEA